MEWVGQDRKAPEEGSRTRGSEARPETALFGGKGINTAWEFQPLQHWTACTCFFFQPSLAEAKQHRAGCRVSSSLTAVLPRQSGPGQEQSEGKNVGLEPFLFLEQKKVIVSSLGGATVWTGERVGRRRERRGLQSPYLTGPGSGGVTGALGRSPKPCTPEALAGETFASDLPKPLIFLPSQEGRNISCEREMC